MDRLDMYSEFAIVGTIRHLTDRNDGCSIDRKELIAKLTKLFGDKARAENALKKAESWELVIVNDKGCSLSLLIQKRLLTVFPNHGKETSFLELNEWTFICSLFFYNI